MFDHLPNKYQSEDVEAGWYDWWDQQGLFRPSADKNAEPFSIILPPPNVTGHLHLGHALTVTIQDALVRWYTFHHDPDFSLYTIYRVY